MQEKQRQREKLSLKVVKGRTGWDVQGGRCRRSRGKEGKLIQGRRRRDAMIAGAAEGAEAEEGNLV